MKILKTIIASILVLLITSLISVNEVRASYSDPQNWTKFSRIWFRFSDLKQLIKTG